MPGNRKIPLNGYGHIGRLALSGGDALSYDDIKLDAEDVVEKAKAENLPKVYILREQYEAIDPEIIRQQENEHHCVLVPVDRYEMERIQATAVPYTIPPPMPKIPEIVMLDNPHRGKYGGHGTPRIEPKDYRKKKKAKRRAEKQARRRRN